MTLTWLVSIEGLLQLCVLLDQSTPMLLRKSETIRLLFNLLIPFHSQMIVHNSGE